MNQFIKRIARNVLFLFALLIMAQSDFVHGEIHQSSFQDVNSHHWGFNSIQWGKQQGIIDGYPDGTFKPDDQVSQMEFLAMLIRAYIPTNKLSSSSPVGYWGRPYLQYAYDMGWGGSIISPPSGKLSSDDPFDIPQKRVYVAKLITNTNGRNYSPLESIQYLLDASLSIGKTDKSIEGFKADDFLTRAEAITFIKNLKEKQSMLYPAPGIEQKYDISTLKLSAFENYPLIVEQPQTNDNVSRFSKLVLVSPTAGYNLINTSVFIIKADVEVAIGPGLIIEVERWEDGFFKIFKSQHAPVFMGEMNEEIELPESGVYRVKLLSYYEKDGFLTELKMPVTNFLVESKAK